MINYFISQQSSDQEKFYHLAFAKIVETKKHHAKFFAHLLARADIPLPKVGGTLAEFAGSIVGESLELAGQVSTCKMGVALENKTLTAYHELIREVESDQELTEKLMEFLLEEEFHTLWLQDYAKRLKQKECPKNGLAGVAEEHPTINVNMRWL